MTLIALILSLIAERFIGILEDLRQFSWFQHYLGYIHKHNEGKTFLNGYFGAILALAVFALPLGFLFYKLADHKLIYFAASLPVLLFCLGPKTFYEDVKSYCLATETHNQNSAEWYAAELLNRPLVEEEKQQLNYTVLQAMFIAASDRLLGVIFWFVLLGPWGAIIYRLSSQANLWARYNHKDGNGFGRALERINQLINWLPSRLIAVSYAITGNFMESMGQCRKQISAYCPASTDRNENALICAGIGAMGIDANAPQNDKKLIENALSLVRRTVVFWIGAVAFLTLTGVVK